jgi:hypothetical protein
MARFIAAPRDFRKLLFAGKSLSEKRLAFTRPWPLLPLAVALDLHFEVPLRRAPMGVLLGRDIL